MKHEARTCVIGVGYVGLIQAVGLATLGVDVVCVETDTAKVAQLNVGIPPIFEEGLEEALAEVLRSKKIWFETTMPEDNDFDICFFAVGTPTSVHTGNARLDYLESAIFTAASRAKNGSVFVVKSTVPIGSCSKYQRWLHENYPEKNISVVSNPEFLREGSALKDFFNPDRIVIGGSDNRAISQVICLYEVFVSRGVPVVSTDTITSESIKYAANAFLAMKVTFINEVADLMEAVGGDVDEVARGIGLDSRIGLDFLRAGPGFGGSCFPKDTLALATLGRRNGVQQRIIETVISVNDGRRFQILKRIEKSLGDRVYGKTIALLGLAFKANTDDVRESPSLDLLHALLEEGAAVNAYDPVARYSFDHAAFRQVDSIEEACEGASAILCATEWPEFKSFDFTSVADKVKRRYIFDMRRIIDLKSTGLDGWEVDRIGGLRI